eukprot:gene5193-7227_t
MIDDPIPIAPQQAPIISTKKKNKTLLALAKSKEDKEMVKNVVSTNIASHWLKQFLGKKRVNDVPPIPDIEPVRDDFLIDFHKGFENSKKENDSVDENENEGSVKSFDKDENHRDSFDISDDEKKSIENIDVNLDDIHENHDKVSSNNESGLVGNNNSNCYQFTLSNLLFGIKEKQIRDFGASYGFDFKTITFLLAKNSTRPAGSAMIDIEFTEEYNTASLLQEKLLQSLNGQSCCGRDIRVQIHGVNNSTNKPNRSFNNNNNRYYDLNIAFKCNNCGEVGHKQADCPQAPIPQPCHLCAGKDHEAGNCPNITCFNCGQFGHHSRNCNEKRSGSRAMICTECGSTHHFNKDCPDLIYPPNNDNEMISANDSKRLSDPFVRCMSCDLYGHLMCMKLPYSNGSTSNSSKRKPDLYCPNCGKKGHHVDLVFTSVCQRPKYEALSKYQQLQNVDWSDEDEKDAVDNMIKGWCRFDKKTRALFPFVEDNYNNNNYNNNYSNNNNQLGRSFSDGDKGNGKHTRFDYRDYDTSDNRRNDRKRGRDDFHNNYDNNDKYYGNNHQQDVSYSNRGREVYMDDNNNNNNNDSYSNKRSHNNSYQSFHVNGLNNIAPPLTQSRSFPNDHYSTHHYRQPPLPPLPPPPPPPPRILDHFSPAELRRLERKKRFHSK